MTLLPLTVAEVAATFPFDLTRAAVRHDGWDRAFVHPYKGEDANINAMKRGFLVRAVLPLWAVFILNLES